MKLFASTLLAVVGILVALVVWYRWDSASNRGYQFGYFGNFNRVSNALASIPGVSISEAWANHDVTLEEFGFTATIGSGQTIRIAVGEHDYIRDLSGEPLIRALKRDIETQTNR